ncbi:MAG: diaminopimelate epimerase [Bacteroidales bacterium]|nr:diaminopimelate epimerase [Bacteroidales bacterium]
MLVHFSKYHGTGNDFVMIDGRDLESSFFHTDLINRLCDRRFGVGGDGLIILEESRGFDFTMRYFNADGREGTMCGNGGRCIAAFARQLGIVSTEATFDGIDGAHTASILPNSEVRLKLVDVSGIERLEDGYLLNTGSPHFVKLVKNLKEIDVEREGAEIRHQERFGSGGVNVNFLEPESGSGQIAVRTFERGVERETWSCGTGVAAAAIMASFHFRSDILSYQVETRGGQLNVSFKAQGHQHFTHIYLTGPVSHVYDGTIDIIV